MINLYEDIDFVFNCDHDFKNRFNGEPDYFTAKGEQKGLLLETNFVADAVNLPLITAKERGAGGGHIRFNMAKGSMNSHISQFPIGTYKKGHAHGPGAHVIILSGEGYSLMWPEGEEPQALRLGGRHADRAAQHVVPPALQLPAPRRRAISPSSTRWCRSATRRACRRPGSAGASAATRSTTPTSSRWCARCSPRSWPSTAWQPRMDQAYAQELADLPPKQEAAA